MNKLTYCVIVSSAFILYSCATLNPQNESAINPNDIVRWSDTTKLSWDDFQGQPIKDAQIGGEILIQTPASLRKSTLFLPAITTVECYMDKKASWVVKSKAKPQLLFYNQTLFDIYELYARKLRKKFSEATFGIVDPGGVFNSIQQANNVDLGKAITQYRSESGMGANNKKIKEWSDKIAKELEELKDFKAK